MQEWRNGRRAGLRIQFPKGSGGSSPSSCTIKKEFVMVQNDKICCLVNQNKSNNSFLFTVSVPAMITESFFQLATHAQQNLMNPIGFKKGSAPISYIQEHFKTPILSHLKDLGLKFISSL